MGNVITVTPELLRTTAQRIGQDLEHAIAISSGYQSGHENVVQGGGFVGQAAGASLMTAGQLDHDLQQIMMGCQRLIHGLNKTAAIMEAHEDDATHSFNALFDGTTNT